MKATEQYFPVVLIIMLYKVVLKFFSWEWILQCDHSNDTSLAVLSCSISSFSAIYKINDILKVGKFWLLLLLGIKGLTIKTNFYTFNINPFLTTFMSDWLVLLHGETECWSLLGGYRHCCNKLAMNFFEWIWKFHWFFQQVKRRFKVDKQLCSSVI